MDEIQGEVKEWGRDLYVSVFSYPNILTSSDIVKFLKERKILHSICLYHSDFTPYLRTRSGIFRGFWDIRRYSEKILEVKEREGYFKEPLGGLLVDSNNAMHFDNVSVQCAPLDLVLANFDYQERRREELARKKK